MVDANNDSKEAGKPSWQQDIKTPTTPVPPLQKQITDKADLKTAKKFLEDEQVRNASLEEKERFLATKGLGKDIIKQLLLPSSSHALIADPSNTDTPNVPSSTPSTMPSTTSVSSSSTSQAMNSVAQISPNKAAHSVPQPDRQSPPIVTYPEFLITPPKPAPLITANRLLTTLYLFGGFSALLYGTSTYIIAPLVESLAESRHDLAVTTQTNLDKLISRLEGIVSKAPVKVTTTLASYRNDSDSDSDPTEMFHRDIGIQTSPFPSRPITPILKPIETSTVEVQTSRLSALGTHLQDLRQNSQSEAEDSTELSTTLDVVREYVQSLAFSTATYGNTFNGYPGVDKEENNDEISKIKAQIRGVKGVLLSARTFPSSTVRR